MNSFLDYLIISLVCTIVFALIIRSVTKEYNEKYNEGYNKELYIKNHITLYTMEIDKYKRTKEDIEYIFGKN